MRRGGQILAQTPASGLVTAMEPMMRACGGVWVAHGSGDADREVTDARSRLGLPADDPRYTLRRVWLSKEEEDGYYYGFANEGLWPLCHIVHTRPLFRPRCPGGHLRAHPLAELRGLQHLPLAAGGRGRAGGLHQGPPGTVPCAPAFFERYPEYRERMVFVQVAAPSRTRIKRYQELEAEVEETVRDVNRAFQTRSWQPIVYRKRHHERRDIWPLYWYADFCMVTSLHDGMNLVAKEFVSTRDDEDGVLILSRFTGAHRSCATRSS